MAAVSWVLVEAGTCLFGDDLRPVHVKALWWTASPVTIGQLGNAHEGQDQGLPVTGLTWREATSAAERLGGRLPRSVEWEYMAAGPDRRSYPWGQEEPTLEHAALADSGLRCPVPVGRHPRGATPHGIQDVAGNVWEWTASQVMGGGFIIRGGSYASQPLYARTTFLNAAPGELGSPGIGFRVVRPA